MISKIRNIIFDFDGTLVNSAEDIIDCLKTAYSHLPELGDIEISRKIIGPSLPEMVKLITPRISEQQLAIVIREFRNCYDKSNFSKTKMYDTTRVLLNKLFVSNIKIFLVTNKPFLPTQRILKNLSINNFCDRVTPDITPKKVLNKTEMVSYLISKWGLQKDNTLLVGDSVSDIHAARNNGLISAAVLSGYGDKSAICDSHPDYIFDEISGLYDLIHK